MATKVQLTGGAFQTVDGSPLANGYLLMNLSQDSVVVGSPSLQIAAGYTVKIQLDASGNVATSTPQYVWPNDVLTPANTFYSVAAYTATGELVWGPNSQQVFSSPSPYDIGAWRPNIINTGSALTVTNYDLGVFYPYTFANAQVMVLLKINKTVIFATNLGASTAVCGVNPTATAVMTLTKNGSQFGTITFNTSGVPAISATATTFVAGDILQITAPSTADITFATVGLILSGTLG